MLTEFLHRHRAGVLMVCLSLFSLLCMTLQIGPYVTGVKTSLWFLVSPEIVYSGQFFNKLDSLRGRLFGLIRVEGENVILREQNSRLSKREVERDALEQENNRLRLLLNLHQKSFTDSTPAEVVGHDVREWFHSIVINKGLDASISPSAAVVTASDERPVLVGRVAEVEKATSKVLLLTDGVSAISVSVARNGDMGLLEGRNKPWVLLNYLPQKSDVAAGDEIVTAGLGGLFPPGIPVGHVTSVEDSEDGFFKEAKVAPAANLSSLREILVLERKVLEPKEEKE